MHSLHYFNPGHETAVFQGKTINTPSRNVRKMTEDLSALPLWYAKSGDFILTESPDSAESFVPEAILPAVTLTTIGLLKEKKTLLPPLQATPWGLSPASLYYMEQVRIQTGISLEVPAWQESFTPLTGRQTAVTCLQTIKEKLPHLTLPEVPRFTEDMYALETYLKKHPGPYVFKSPYSSSGRGLLWTTGDSLTPKEKEWITGAIRKQGCVSMERVLKKVADFGWEFLSDGKGTIYYAGISPFQTNAKGSFTGNRIQSQASIHKELFRIFPEQVYTEILEATISTLKTIYSHLYKGCIGVDIMLYQDEAGNYLLHPCVEINMRYTMGYLSLQLGELLAASSSGKYELIYKRDSKELFEQHQQMQKQYPLKIEKGKIQKGYLSLCPVTPTTNYKAFILVE